MGKTVVLIMLGATLVFCLGMLVKAIVELLYQRHRQKKVVEFFEMHKPTVGALLECEKIESEAKLTYEFQGKYKPSKPNYRCEPNQYYVTVIVREKNGVVPAYLANTYKLVITNKMYSVS